MKYAMSVLGATALVLAGAACSDSQSFEQGTTYKTGGVPPPEVGGKATANEDPTAPAVGADGNLTDPVTMPIDSGRIATQEDLGFMPDDLADATGSSKAGPDGKNNGKGTGAGNGFAPGPDTAAALNLACSSAATSGVLKTTTVSITFPATTTCEWEVGGNLSRVDGRLRARREQFVTIEVPKATRLCDMRFDAPMQTMRYDDEILLVLNDYVLASSQDYAVSSAYPAGLQRDAQGFVKYKWAGAGGLADQHYGQQVTPAYCLGWNEFDPEYAEACQIPATETTGQMQIAIPAAKIRELSLTSGIRYDVALGNAEGTPTLKAKLGFITVGDNDNGDCSHASFTLNVVMEYLAP